MKNKDIGCKDIAESIRSTMGIANFTNLIQQEEGEKFRQFRVSSVTGDQENAVMLMSFAGKGFKINVSYDPDYKRGAKDEHGNA
jgi:hypothetical protein